MVIHFIIIICEASRSITYFPAPPPPISLMFSVVTWSGLFLITDLSLRRLTATLWNFDGRFNKVLLPSASPDFDFDLDSDLLSMLGFGPHYDTCTCTFPLSGWFGYAETAPRPACSVGDRGEERAMQTKHKGRSLQYAKRAKKLPTAELC